MQLELLYAEPGAVAEDRLTLNVTESHHLTRVLRQGKGDAFFATDGLGHVFTCVVVGSVEKRVVAAITDRRQTLSEPGFQLTLAVSLPKKDRFEWIVEKGTEIGVGCFQPLISERCVVTSKSLKAERCHKIALSAMKQSGRACLPTINSPKSFSEFLKTTGSGIGWLAHEQELKTNLASTLAFHRDERPTSGVLCVGPEGGFTDQEVSLARQAGFHSFGMGPRRLRTETAAILGAGLVLSEMGDLG